MFFLQWLSHTSLLAIHSAWIWEERHASWMLEWCRWETGPSSRCGVVTTRVKQLLCWRLCRSSTCSDKNMHTESSKWVYVCSQTCHHQSSLSGWFQVEKRREILFISCEHRKLQKWWVFFSFNKHHFSVVIPQNTHRSGLRLRIEQMVFNAVSSWHVSLKIHWFDFVYLYLVMIKINIFSY